MLPVPIGADSWQEMDTLNYREILTQNKVWVAENARTLRRFISSLKLGVVIDTLEIFEFGGHANMNELHRFLENQIQKSDIVVTSEAGLPGMADPGGIVAFWAHQNNIPVKSKTGPGSIYLTLQASGLSGQQFTFHGYTPVKEDELKIFLKDKVQQVKTSGYTQIFMETPYRTERLFATILDIVPADMYLCLGANLHGEGEFIKTTTIQNWKKTPLTLGKSPAVFLLGKPA
jgi:16S rRNA (cytidine1402-2'-O)-methyltransferase